MAKVYDLILICLLVLLTESVSIRYNYQFVQINTDRSVSNCISSNLLLNKKNFFLRCSCLVNSLIIDNPLEMFKYTKNISNIKNDTKVQQHRDTTSSNTTTSKKQGQVIKYANTFARSSFYFKERYVTAWRNVGVQKIWFTRLCNS